jgi:hypothetical protein
MRIGGSVAIANGGGQHVPSRNGYQNWDASVWKYFPVHESVRLQFRGELIDALNHPWRPSASNPGGGGAG